MTKDAEQFAQAIQHHRRSLLAYAFTCSRDLSVAEDVVQETCLIAMKKKDQYEEFIDFGAWLIAIARRVWLQECDRRRINTKAMTYLHDNASIIFTPENFQETWQEEKVALKSCLKKLEAEDQDMLKTHFEHKEKYQSLATRLNCTVASIKVRMFRLRKSLRQCINRKLEAVK
ncbi:MAG: sigma-70 family RNA polymerase sigma factor [Lentisphaeraceae bacterium]|nr:sigma-70 family RNA polymerase sigma factor [Lentisphaeraceae bacterium]